MNEERPRTTMVHDASPDPIANTIAVGTVGYDHAAWQGGFYDAELPADWRFLHYCNQFRAVLLPAGTTRAWLDGAATTFVDDSDDAFRFVIEINDALLEDGRLDTALDSLGMRLWGVVYRDGNPPSSVGALERIAATRPLAIDTAGDGGALAARLRVSTVWHAPGKPVPPPGPLVVVRIGEAALVDMRRTMEVLGSPAHHGARRGVFFDHVETAVRQARDCRILAELMGL